MSKSEWKGPWLLVTGAALFIVACAVKWYYLAQQHYYIRLSDEAFGAYDFAGAAELGTLLKRIFLSCDYTLGSCRPFFTNLLYILTFNKFGYEPQAAFTMGILVGSLLIPLYFLAVRALVNAEVALAATAILMWMTNYVYQSIALTTILPGVLFITGALLAAIHYHRGGGAGYLYLSGALLGMSVFCRYENAFLLPAFLGYELFFDKRRNLFSKLLYGLVCASSGLFICWCNDRLSGDPFHVIWRHIEEAHRCRNAVPVTWAKAFEMVWELLRRLLDPLLWWGGAIGMILMIKRHGLKALWLFSGASVLPLFLIYKIKTGTLDFHEDYFFLLPLMGLPAGLECVRAVFTGLGRRRFYGMMALGAAAVFFILLFCRVNRTPPYSRYYYPPELIRLTEDLKRIPAAEILYIENVINQPGLYIQDVLAYLKRDPKKYAYLAGANEPRERKYYLLTWEDLRGKVPLKEAAKVRDYSAYGYPGLTLYHVTRVVNESDIGKKNIY